MKHSKQDYIKVISFLNSLDIHFSEHSWKEPITNFDFINIEIDKSSICTAGHISMDFINGEFVGFSSWE